MNRFKKKRSFNTTSEMSKQHNLKIENTNVIIHSETMHATHRNSIY